MVKEQTKQKTVKISFEIPLEGYNLLKKLSNSKYSILEYRDGYDDLEEFKKSDDFIQHNRTIDWFNARNENGTRKLAYELYERGLLKDVEDSWHISFELSDFGKQSISILAERDRNLEQI